MYMYIVYIYTHVFLLMHVEFSACKVTPCIFPGQAFQARPLFLNHPWDYDHCKYHTVDAPVTVQVG